MRTGIGKPDSLDRQERRTSAAGEGRRAGTLTAAYERCHQLYARHGHTYYLATLLLPCWKRRHVHALHGFTRYADELVDDLAAGLSPADLHPPGTPATGDAKSPVA